MIPVFYLCIFWNALQRYKNNLLFANNSAKIRRFNISFSLKFCNKIEMWVNAPRNGRETGGRTEVPPVPSALCTSTFERGHVSMWGTFSNSLIFRDRFIEYSQSLVIFLNMVAAYSPTASNSQSVRSGLAVRRDGIISLCKTLFPSKRKTVSLAVKQCFSGSKTPFYSCDTQTADER